MKHYQLLGSTLLMGVLLVPLAAQSSADLTEDDFFSDSAPTVATTTVSTADPTAQFTKNSEGVRWSGSASSGANWNGTWTDWPDTADLTKNYTESLGYTLATTLNLDGRPTKDFRFHFSLKAGAPFVNETSVLKSATYTPAVPANAVYPGSPAVAAGVTTAATTVSVPAIKIWEMYTDVTLADALFLRFGKQSAAWGVAYFYSPGDVISLTAKDATDPTASREGPVALSATLPFPGLKANLNGYVLLRDDYFPAGAAPKLENLGYALQGDILLGDAQLSLGGFYQKDNAPKAVATINTGLGFLPIPELNKVNLFSEGIALYGADVLRGTGSATVATKSVFESIDKWDASTVYYTGTVGASYSNSDLNLNLRTEYWYNPFGSDDKAYPQRAFNTYLLSQAAASKALLKTTADRAWGFGDVANPGIHNLTTLISLSKLLGSQVNFSTLIQQNLSDGSGWAKPSFSWSPWDELSFSAGWSQVWGDDGTQFPLQFQDFSTGKTKKFAVSFSVNFGTGKF